MKFEKISDCVCLWFGLFVGCGAARRVARALDLCPAWRDGFQCVIGGN